MLQAWFTVRLLPCRKYYLIHSHIRGFGVNIAGCFAFSWRLPIKALQIVRYPPTPLAGGQKTSAGTLLFNQDFLAPALTLFQTHPRPLSAFASATADKQGGEPLRPNPCPSPSAFCLLPCVLRPASCVFLSPTLPFSPSPLHPLQLLQPFSPAAHRPPPKKVVPGGKSANHRGLSGQGDLSAIAGESSTNSCSEMCLKGLDWNWMIRIIFHF